MEFYRYTLPNGIRCIHKRTKSPIAYSALTINTGSRDELDDEFGIAHFVEHSIFKGTTKRKAHHINCRLERLGGELNAFTTKEETVIHATTLKGDFAKSAELISDVIFNSTFPERELDKEREIIIDEINSYKDSPVESIFDDFEDLIFAGSSLGHNILGSKKSVKKFNQDKLKAFTSRTHNTNEMVFSSIGNMSQRSFESIIARNFGEVPRSDRAFNRLPVESINSFNSTIKKATHQANCIMGSRAYALNDKKRVVLALLTNILGGPAANSLLNMSVREKNGLSYNIEASYTPFTDTGLATIYFGCDKENTDLCIELVNKQLDNIKSGGLTARQLSMSKKQFIGQMAIAMESDESYMLGSAKSFLIYNDVDSNEMIYKKIVQITPTEVVDVANEIFNDLSILIYK